MPSWQAEKPVHGHFVIAVTAVGANIDGLPALNQIPMTPQLVLQEDTATPPVATPAVPNEGPTVNVLFPDLSWPKDLHGTEQHRQLRRA